jgi:hypothetical protein
MGFTSIRRTKAEQLAGVEHIAAKKIAHNTVEYTRPDGTKVIRLHLTDIMEFLPDGSVRLDTGGFKTHTTKDRLNQYLPKPWQVWAHQGIWYISKSGIPGDYVFSDGVVIYPNGNLSGINPDESTRCRSVAKKINKYCKALAKLDELPTPNEGDCWYCLLQTGKGQSLGDVSGDTDHLMSHLDEMYFVGSMIMRAMQHAGCTGYMINAAFSNDSRIQKQARGQVVRAVRRYLRAKLGLSS